jgi:hypothetical protein
LYLSEEEGGDLSAAVFQFVLENHGRSEPSVPPVAEFGPLAIHGHFDVRRMHGGGGVRWIGSQTSIILTTKINKKRTDTTTQIIRRI